MADAEDLAAIIESYHEALRAIINGDPGGYKALYSEGGGPKGDHQRRSRGLQGPLLGGRRHQPSQSHGLRCGKRSKRGFRELERAASKFGGGEVVGFESIATCVTPELGYIIEVERCKAKVGGAADLVPIALRVTSVFRPEHGAWKLVHRHADPPASTWFARSPAD